MDEKAPRTGHLDGPEIEALMRDFGNLSPETLVFFHKTTKVIAPKKICETGDQGSQSDSQSTYVSTTQTNVEVDNNQTINKPAECLTRELSRDETARLYLEQYQIYISHCVKPDDITLHLHCFTEEQKLDIHAEKNLIKGSRRAIEMLLHEVEDSGRFVALRDALDNNNGYPKIVRILDGEYNPEDQNYVKIVELFTPEIIVRLEPSELMPRLLSKGVFKQIDIEEISAEEKNHGPMRASCVLLMYLPRRTVDWFRCFLDALIDCDLEDIAEMLDPDLFKDITQQNSPVSDVKNVNRITALKEKPIIPPKPLIKERSLLAKISTATKQQTSVRSNKVINKCETKIAGESGAVLYDAGEGEKVAVGETNEAKEDETFEHIDDVVITNDDNVDVESIAENNSEREKFDKCMAECDAKVIWLDERRGKNKILLKSISKDSTDRNIWLRKKIVWKRNVIVRLKQYFEQTAQCKQRNKGVSPSISKILSGRDTPCQSQIKPRILKQAFCSKFRKENFQTETDEGKKEPVPEECLKSVQRCAVCKMSCGRRIWIVKGSLVDLKVDVMINSTDNHLSLATGLAETISKRGGGTIKKACMRHIESQRSIDEGEIFVTEAGDLTAKHVIHVNSPVWKGGQEGEQTLLKEAVMKSMLQASKRNAVSIALPAISCGISGFSGKVATELIVRAVRNFFREEQDSGLEQVYLVDIKSDVVKRFCEALKTVFREDEKCKIKLFGT